MPSNFHAHDLCNLCLLLQTRKKQKTIARIFHFDSHFCWWRQFAVRNVHKSRISAPNALWLREESHFTQQFPASFLLLNSEKKEKLNQKTNKVDLARRARYARVVINPKRAS